MATDSRAGVLGELGELKTFAEIARALPPSRRLGRPVHSSTISRWRCPGMRSRDGSRITLRCVRLPSGWMTSLEWVREFIDAVTADKAGDPAPAPAIRTTARRRREIDRAKRELTAAGIL
jgi:hypothetical protein